MSSVLAPATPPESDPVETTPPPEQSAMPPTDVETVPPPAPVIPIQVAPLPSLLPPEIVTSPAPILAPVIPVISPPVTVTPALPPATVTPTLPPVTSPPLPQPEPEPEPQPQPQPHPQPQPQPQPLPPTITPSPVTDITPPKNINPPNILPPTDKPVTVTPAPPTSTSKSATPSSPSSPTVQPPVTVRQPKSGPTTKPGPAITGPTKPGPSERPPKTSNSNPAAAKLRPHSPLPASAVLPSAPPLALPVPQTPSGGAWFPSASVPPSVLPSIPGTPAGEVNSPATPSTTTTPFFGETNGASASSSSSSAPSGVADHQNIQAAVPSGGGSGGSNVYVVGLLVGGALLLLLGAVFVILAFCCRRKRNKLGDQGSGKMHASPFINGFEEKSSLPQYRKQGSFDVNSAHGNTKATGGTALAVTGLNPGMGAHLSSGTFAYEELAEATSGFSEQNILGQGGFGFVHKGVLRNGKEVAVKQLKMGGDQGEREFRAEVDTISQVHHKHLVSLVGYCISGPERLLVYEFVPNNTLDFHLHGKDQPVMDWSTRLKIAIGSAKGLAYLHEDCSPTIIHRDIKASNILLDFNCEAKVSDFGLAKIFSSTNPSVTHMTTRVVGTFGYLAPEYASSGKVTDKTDVYSYGVVLLELITGRTPISNFGTSTNGSLVNWARPLLAQAIADGSFDTLADPRLQHSYKGDEMAIMVSCAAACVRLSSWRRPRMSQVIRALEGNLSASELDDGIKPGHSSMHFPYESLDFDARHYIEEMKKMALAASSRYSDNTSEYGLNPSVSSTDTSQHIC